MVYPIAGVRDAARSGLGVEENVGLLRRYLYAEQRLCLLLAGHLPSVPEMAIKQGIGRHLWEDAAGPPSTLARFARSQGVAPPSQAAWRGLDELQRFALIKLTRDSHDNVNFVPAMREFGLVAG